MAAAALRRMSGAVPAKLPPRPGTPGPAGVERPLVLTLLLACAAVTSGKGARRRGGCGDPGTRGARAGNGASEKLRSGWAGGSAGPRRGAVRRGLREALTGAQGAGCDGRGAAVAVRSEAAGMGAGGNGGGGVSQRRGQERGRRGQVLRPWPG